MTPIQQQDNRYRKNNFNMTVKKLFQQLKKQLARIDKSLNKSEKLFFVKKMTL